jgi:zinc protease
MRRHVSLTSLVVCCCIAVTVTSAFAFTPVRRSVLDNGLTLLVSEEHSLPFVTILLLVKAGSKDDPAGQEGVADLTASALLLGAAGRTLNQISEDLDYMGADMGAGANKDYSTLSLRVLKKDIRSAFPIFMDVLMKPSFPPTELKKNISRVLGAIKSSEDRPGVVAERAFEKALYRGGPYAHPTEGTKESVSKLTRDTLKKFHINHYHPNNAIFVIVGDADERMVKEYLVPMLERWPRSIVPQRTAETELAGTKETIKINRPVSQSNIVMGNRAMSRDNPDYYAATVLNHIFGGGSLGSRLMDDIRNRKGLAYSVESFFDARKLLGSFQILLQTKTSSTEEAIRAVMENVERIRSEPVSEQELEDSKSYLVGNFPQKLSSQSRIASFLSQVEYYGLGLDYPEEYPRLIGSVTTEDVLRVARSYLLPENFVVVLVTDLNSSKAK